jgi:hypothetical protein
VSEALDLSGAKVGQFDLMPSGWQDAHVHEVEPIEIEKDDGKLPMGTPGYNIQFKVDGGEYDGRSQFNRFYLPQAGEYDEDKRQTMLGRFADFLIAIGYAQSDITSGKFKFDTEDTVGRQCRILIGQDKAGEYNQVRNFKPIGANVEEAGII